MIRSASTEEDIDVSTFTDPGSHHPIGSPSHDVTLAATHYHAIATSSDHLTPTATPHDNTFTPTPDHATITTAYASTSPVAAAAA